LAAHYAELLAAQAESGLSVAAFAAQAQVSAATLYSWRRRLRGERHRARLLEVSVVEGGQDADRESMTVQLGRFRIGVPTDFDERTLSRLVGALERC
jgi:hypothetical protein